MEQYFHQWLANLPSFLGGYIYDDDKHLISPRNTYETLKSFVLGFSEGALDEKIILLPGIRGVGKTTLLAQLYFFEKYISEHAGLKALKEIKNKIYISADHLSYNGFSLKDFIGTYEKYIGMPFENLTEKTIILIDEIHYDSNWGLALKLLYDKTKSNKNILLFATGSSALSLKASPDLARRSRLVKVYPLNFREYTSMKYHTQLPENDVQTLRSAVFDSRKSTDAFDILKSIEKNVNHYWEAIPAEDIEIDRYFSIGSFPFNLKSGNRALAWEKIISVVDKVVEYDFTGIRRFDSETISKIPNILYVVSASGQLNLGKFSSSLGININTLRRVLDTMVKAEILIKIPSFGKMYTQTRKQLKYLFTAPSIRESMLRGMVPENMHGKKLEDYSALILHESMDEHPGMKVFYDSAEGGADFIVGFPDERHIIIEIGFGKENTGQITFTAKKVKPDCAFLAGSRRLELVEGCIIKIPLHFWLLI